MYHSQRYKELLPLGTYLPLRDTYSAPHLRSALATTTCLQATRCAWDTVRDLMRSAVGRWAGGEASGTTVVRSVARWLFVFRRVTRKRCIALSEPCLSYCKRETYLECKAWMLCCCHRMERTGNWKKLLFIRSLFASFVIYSFVHSFVRSFVHSFIQSLIHLFIWSFSCLFVHLFVHSFIHFFVPSFIWSFVHLFVH